LKFRIKLGTLFLFVFVLISFFTFIALYNQYKFSRNIVIQNFVNKELLFTSKIKEKLKSMLSLIQFSFKSSNEECIKKTEILKLLYNKGDFNSTKIAELFNKDNKELGYYEVYVIGKNYKVIDSSYKPDIGFDLGAFKVYKKILDDVFNGKKKIDISYPHIDYSSMNVKKYYLVKSPDGKVLLELGYVVDIYSMIDKIRKEFIKEIPELKSINVYFVEKYFVYKINFEHRNNKKIPLSEIIKNSNSLLQKLFNINLDKTYNVSFLIEKMFSTKDTIVKFEKDNLKILTIIRGVFNNATDKLILETDFDISKLKKDLEILKRRFFITFLILTLALFILYKFLILKVSKELNDIVLHMKKNLALKNTYSFIEEIYELKKYYNEFRKTLNKEIEKNKKLLMENRRFIVDTIHQIKTPLSVMTLNIDYVKEKIKDEELKDILEEIEASVAMLTNSYEDLSYISGNGIVKYEANEILNLSKFLKERIKFFDVVAKANNKIIISDIKDNICFKINRIEFERIVDNNISNAIKYSTKKEIYVSLDKDNNEIILKFASFGERIKNPKSIFKRNYREHSHKRGLGIGLNIVKEICQKYDIKYNVYYEDGKNVFEYRFKGWEC